jgi:hypothetical protein
MIAIDDDRFRREAVPVDELQAEVQMLLDRDQDNPGGTAHVTTSVLRRYPDTPDNLAIQVAILEGEIVRRQTLLDITSWVLVGQLFFKFLGKWSAKG